MALLQRLRWTVLLPMMGAVLVAMLAEGGPVAWGQEEQLESEEDDGLSRSPRFSRSSPFSVLDDPTRARSDILVPTLSFFLPGLDQWLEGQYSWAAAYTGTAVGGLVWASAVAAANPPPAKDGERDGSGGIDAKDITTRKIMLGGLLYQGAGGMSAWHSFRTAVRSRALSGQYRFLAKEESPGEVLMAPLRFSYLTRPTTFVPLSIGAALAALVLRSEVPETLERSKFESSDAFFSTAYSWNAGTHEEAMFRGWIMPVMNEAWSSPMLANTAQSLLFAAAHLNTNPTPLPQLLLGWHLGYVTQRDRWTIGEAVFIHHWWNVMAFATLYHFQKKPDAPATLKRARLWLPSLELRF